MAELVAGAAVGTAFGVVIDLLKKVIKLAKLAYHCKTNCESLVAVLNSISPLLESVAASANGNQTCLAWLESIHVLLEKAEKLVEKCTEEKRILRRDKLSSQLLEIESQIRMKIPESNLITLDIVQAIATMMMRGRSNPVLDSIPASIMQDIPSKTMPFVTNPFEKFKSIIISAVTAIDASITIGLKGRGGAGKTLLAKMIHNDNDIQSKYGADSIMWITVGQETTIPFHYLTMAKLMGVGGDYEHNHAHRPLEDQRSYLMQVFKGRKILLILDDVWDNHGPHNRTMMEWLDIAKGVGSVTLVTTREVSVLRCAKAKEMMDVQSLSKADSWKLFCIHAFGGEKPPPHEIEDIAKKVCEECDGLPLALKVIGSAMWDKTNKRDWSNVLKYLEGRASKPHSKVVQNNLQRELYNCLRYSYDVLDESLKKCFLYFAAFPEDYRIPTDQLFRIWHAEQLFGSQNAEEVSDEGRGILIDLADRSLIEMSQDEDFVQIHDVLRDLAIHILNDAKPHEWAYECYFHPGKVFETFPPIGKEVKRMSLMGCSISEFPNILELPHLQVCLLSKISSLEKKRRLEIPPLFFSNKKYMRILDICGGDGVEDIALNLEGLESLLYLNMYGYGLLSELPESIKKLKSLTYLDLSGCKSLKELLESIKELKSLTHLDLSGCISLKELPESIKELKSLMHLDLRGCKSLKKLPKSIKELKSLMHLDLRWCESLKELPESIKELKSLTCLDLSGCKSLKELPESIKVLKSLMHLDLSWCESLKELPESIKELKSLTCLDLSGCKSLKELPESIKELKSLTRLDLSGCKSLKELPESIKVLKSLRHLDLRWCESLKELPESIKELKSLTRLDLNGCISLKELPESIKELKSLMHLDLSGCKSLKELPESIKELKSLTCLDLNGCKSLKELPESIKEFKSLTRLDLSGCKSLKELPESIKELKSLTRLDLGGCTSLKELPESIKELKSLTHLDLSGCTFLKELLESIKELKSLTHLDLRRCEFLKELPESIKELKSLTRLDLEGCTSLKELPESIKELKSLTHLDLSRCTSLKKLLESIKELKSLTHLDLSGCESLKELPENIKELKSLTHLNLRGCESLKELLESIKELKSLTHLDLTGCDSLKELPESIKELKSLTRLDLRGCTSLKELPESIKELKSLMHLDLRFCKSLKELPESIKELKSLTRLDLRRCTFLKVLPENIKELKSLVL